MGIFDSFNPFGLRVPLSAEEAAPIEYVIIQRRLSRILAFTGFTIDDVVNDPIAKNAVKGYYRLSRMIDRQMEITELERQWNP